MKKFSFLLGALLLVGNAAFAAHSGNYQTDYSKYSKEKLMAELQRLQAENEALKSKVEVTTTEVETTKVEFETVKTELAEVQKKVPVIEEGHERDWKQVNFNLISGNNMHGFGDTKDDTYAEIEIMGRKGGFDIYGYIDFLDTMHSSSSDVNTHKNDTDSWDSKKDDSDNFFTELQPRYSLNTLFNKDLSVGPVKEWYVAGYVKAGDNDLWTNGIGLGSDIEVPWMGLMGLNLYALFPEEDFDSSREGQFGGYLLKTNWFKPLYFFENGTFIAYQGYANYTWDAGYETSKDENGRANEEIQWFNGLAWHHKDFALQYGLKYVHNMICVDESAKNDSDSTGFEHYFIATYKF